MPPTSTPPHPPRRVVVPGGTFTPCRSRMPASRATNCGEIVLDKGCVHFNNNQFMLACAREGFPIYYYMHPKCCYCCIMVSSVVLADEGSSTVVVV